MREKAVADAVANWSFLIRIVAVLRQTATLLLRQWWRPQNPAAFTRSGVATEGGFYPSSVAP